ncbi:hypothetical protein [Rhizosphaericola mali]|uniref:Uncharacterized protein n=1 Tax=Rhizosphaericola mali TaxID=2545455 RepID=A0A5P2FW79_9BACT|nr:hypothetical protein [Rhizosphaericola mali]QES87425.1 hypothetical protein E0W69_001685 [Rhizosphaericola mali]
MAKDFDYIVTLKKSNTTPITIVCNILMLAAIGTFLYTSAQSLQYGVKLYALWIITALVLFWWILIIFGKKKKPYFRIGFFFAAMGWLLAPIHKIVIGVLYIVAGLLEKQVKFPEEIGVDASGILINSLPKKHVEWKDLKNLMIKDNILTIDYKNNKIFQKEIQDDVPLTMEQEFNTFCKKYLG